MIISNLFGQQTDIAMRFVGMKNRNTTMEHFERAVREVFAHLRSLSSLPIRALCVQSHLVTCTDLFDENKRRERVRW